MGQRPSLSHLTGYPEAVASAQDFAPYGHTDTAADNDSTRSIRREGKARAWNITRNTTKDNALLEAARAQAQWADASKAKSDRLSAILAILEALSFLAY